MTATARTLLAALVLAVPVAVEAFWLHSDDATAGHLVFAGSQLVGWALVLGVVRALRRLVGGGRLATTVLVGVGLQVAFAVAYAVTTVLSGGPWEGVFVLFLLGFLLLAVGGTGWGARLLRAGSRDSGLGLLLVGALGALAVLVGVTPWHDVALLGSYLAWCGVGRGIDRHGADPETTTGGTCHDPHHVRPAADRP